MVIWTLILTLLSSFILFVFVDVLLQVVEENIGSCLVGFSRLGSIVFVRLFFLVIFGLLCSI